MLSHPGLPRHHLIYWLPASNHSPAETDQDLVFKPFPDNPLCLYMHRDVEQIRYISIYAGRYGKDIWLNNYPGITQFSWMQPTCSRLMKQGLIMSDCEWSAYNDGCPRHLPALHTVPR